MQGGYAAIGLPDPIGHEVRVKHDLPFTESVPAAELDEAPDFLRGGGEMGALIRAHDWAATPLGAPQR